MYIKEWVSDAVVLRNISLFLVIRVIVILLTFQSWFLWSTLKVFMSLPYF